MLNGESRSIMIAVAAGLVLAATGQADAKPLKVFILAGQPNMEGPARIDTFDYIGGPEFTFGLTMDAALTEPVLIIKTAWGGKSLHTDFRPIATRQQLAGPAGRPHDHGKHRADLGPGRNQPAPAGGGRSGLV